MNNDQAAYGSLPQGGKSATASTPFTPFDNAMHYTASLSQDRGARGRFVSGRVRRRRRTVEACQARCWVEQQPLALGRPVECVAGTPAAKR
jgi:hypothetical protein